MSNDRPSGQGYVEWLSAETLRQVRVAHRERLQYIQVDLPSQANAEANVTIGYHSRYLFELVQNANDAIVAARENPEWSKEQLYRVRVELTDSALIVANDGLPFLERDVDSIYCWGESSKDPNKSIGYKGIGFKSVLEITESPEIFSRIVQFRFDRETCYRAVREIVGVDEDLRLPITRFVFPCAVDQIEPAADAHLVQRLLSEEKFATVIRLPLQVDVDKVLARIDQDLDPALLLFLNGIDEIEIWINGECIKVLRRWVREPQDGHVGRDLTLYIGKRPVSRWLLFDAPKREIDDRAIIQDLGDKAWERVQKVGFAFAFRLDRHGKLRVDADQSTRLFVYFPTELNTGLRYRIHGDFYIDAARKQVGDRAYNRWLAGQVAAFLSSKVLPELINSYPGDERVVQVLAPCAEVDGFGASLHQAIFESLKTCTFIPDIKGRYRPPDRIMLAPPGAAVDLATFHRFFSPDALCRLHGYSWFPIPEIERDRQAVEFLKRLGARQLDFQDVIRLFDGRDVVGQADAYPTLYHFLWEWWEQVDPAQRARFSFALGRSRCVVIDDDSWIKPHDRLYHAKLRQETPTMPRPIRADVVHPLAYDPDGRAGPTHRLLSTLEPPIRDYDAPDIIVNSIVPLFESGRFPNLSLEERAEVYQYLYGYWQTRRGGGDPDVERVKGQVQVPARRVTNRRRDVWCPANEVYLSSVWSGDDRLERLYDGFEDVAFLYDVRGLDIPQEDLKAWARFWNWLGVSIVPRLLVDEVPHSVLKRERWRIIRKDHPHAGTQLWEDYLRMVETDHATCAAHGKGYRQLRRSVAMEGLANFIENQQVDRLILLYDLLAEHWSHFKHADVPTAEVYCYRSYCPQYSRSAQVPSFFEFLLREAAWIPAQTYVDGEVAFELYKPAHCWFVSAAESPLIRNLLPSPPVQYNKLVYRPFCRDIGMRFVEEAQIGDLVDLLRNLPEQYPDPTVAVSSGRRTASRAIVTLSRWVIERVYNLLAQDVTNAPSSPAGEIPLVATEGNVLRYVYPPEPVFFADDRYHTTRWQDHLPFASLDKNWGIVAGYLGIRPISACVEESCVPGAILGDESSKLELYFKRARPYLLAVVSDQRESETQDVARYLSNLQFQVVENLVVHRRLTISPGKTIVDNDARAYLEETTVERVGSAGRAPRAGVLYVCKGFEENYDLLAGPLAEYVRIPGLADAFVILLDRGGKNGRMRYLKTRGLSEGHVQEMRNLFSGLGFWDEPEEAISESPALARHLLGQISGPQKDEQDETEPLGQDASSLDKPVESEDSGPPPEQVPIEFPEFDLTQVKLVSVDSSDGAVPDEPRVKGRGRGGGGRRDWERDQRLREAYGARGEQLVKLLELERLRGLGLEPPEEFVRWLREEGNETADHDLESKDLVDGKWVDIVIEVKATPAHDFRFHMSKGELICALHKRDRYRLHRVIGVASASPEVYVFDNPYTLWEEGKAVIEPRDTYVTLPDPRRESKGEESIGEDR